MNRLLGAAMWASICAALVAQTGGAPEDVYYLVFLRPAPDRQPISQADAERIQKAHMANIGSMAKRGILVAAGPFGDTPPSISGVFFFKTGSLEEARRIAGEDPTVTEHRNSVDVVVWRGPKGMGEEYFRLHKDKPETPEDMGVHPFCMLHRGSAWERRGEVKEAHDRYANTLRQEGKIGAEGPVESGGDIVELLIFNRIPDEEAQKLIHDDPAVKAGVLRPEFHRWWSAAHVLPR